MFCNPPQTGSWCRPFAPAPLFGVSIVLTAQQIAEKWARNLSQAAASGAIKDGVMAAEVGPTEAAAAAIPKYLASIQEAVSSGRMAQRLQGSTKAYWQAQVIAKGLPIIGSRAQAAKPTTQDFHSQMAAVYADQKATARQQRAQGVDSRTRIDTALKKAEAVKGQFQKRRI